MDFKSRQAVVLKDYELHNDSSEIYKDFSTNGLGSSITNWKGSYTAKDLKEVSLMKMVEQPDHKTLRMLFYRCSEEQDNIECASD